MFVLFISALIVAVAVADQITVTRLKPTVQYDLTAKPLDGKFIASAIFTDSETHVSNFGQLYVTTGAAYSDNDQGFAAGFAEGFLSAERINQYQYNMQCQVDCSGKEPENVAVFFQAQDAWIRSQIALYSATDDLWAYMDFLTNQFDGMMAGYAASDYGKANPLEAWSFTLINAVGDLFDIIPALDRTKRPEFDKMTSKQIREYLLVNGHCSALVKVADDMSDIYVGHSSWFTYSAMLRIYKTYHFNLNNKSNKGVTTSFSSYPGVLSSLDDFYMMGESKLMMIQTTNNIINQSLWDLIVPESLLGMFLFDIFTLIIVSFMLFLICRIYIIHVYVSFLLIALYIYIYLFIFIRIFLYIAWHRVRSANQLANSGPEWFNIVSRYNSGTYNNQYMIVDGKLFKAGNALPENTLFVVEQIPGLMVGKDISIELAEGHFGSFNVPYHHEIYEASGYPYIDRLDRATTYTQYQMAPRAQIFRRDQTAVKDMESFKVLMRSNSK